MSISQQGLFLMFYRPCIVIYPYSMNQLDAQSCVMLTGCFQQPVNTMHDYTNCCLYRVDLPDDEQQAYLKHVDAYY